MGRNQNQQKTVQSESQSSQKKQKKRSYTTYLDIAIDYRNISGTMADWYSS